MSRRVHLPALVSLLALVACGTRHARIDIDTDGGPDAPGTETPVTETPVAGTTGDATPDGGEGLTVDPTTGEPVATDADPTGTLPSGIETAEADARKAGKAGRRFRWDETAADLDLESELRGGKVATSTTGPWTSRTSGGSFGPAGGFGRRGRSGARMAELGAGPADFSGGGLAVHEEGMVASRKSAVVAPTPRRGTADGAPPPGMPTRPMPVAQSALKAGSTDDNADLDAYRAFVEEWTAPGRLHAAFDTLDISDARTLVVTDPVGRPVPGAQVSVTDLATDTLVWPGTTYGDGTAPWYPHLRAGLLGEPDVDGSMGYAVQAHHDGVFTTQMVGARDDVVRLTLDESATGPTKVDVVFLIDTTGSMGDEIHRIKSTLLSTTAKVRGLDRDVDLQYGAVLYRDLGDEYVTRAHPLTGDIQGFDGALQGIQANGGGDGPSRSTRVLRWRSIRWTGGRTRRSWSSSWPTRRRTWTTRRCHLRPLGAGGPAQGHPHPHGRGQRAGRPRQPGLPPDRPALAGQVHLHRVRLHRRLGRRPRRPRPGGQQQPRRHPLPGDRGRGHGLGRGRWRRPPVPAVVICGESPAGSHPA